jgi:hypothetical protein
MGSAKDNGRESKTCLGRVFKDKLGCSEDVHETHVCGCTPMSIVENSAQVLSRLLKFVHGYHQFWDFSLNKAAKHV